MSTDALAAAPDLDRLTRPLPPLSPRALRYALARLGLVTVGRLSRGIRIGRAHGFDSGAMLDHVYENRAQGTGPVGRLIDRVFLDAPGWAGIRNRGHLLQQTIVEQAVAAYDGRCPLTLIDLACGGGRYVLDALVELRGTAVSVDALLRDYREVNVATARDNAECRGITATIRQGDALDDAGLATLPRADLVVVSGLHEIIDDDTVVRRHMAQVARLLRPGGRLLLTVQPDHPQAEFIARVLVSHTGRPWAMRLRPVDLTRAWLEEAGFVVERLTFEARGIFGVLVARRA